MSSSRNLSRLLTGLSEIGAGLPFEDHVSQAAERLRAFLADALGTRPQVTPHLCENKEYPYITNDRDRKVLLPSENQTLLDTALLLVNHHLELVRESMCIRDSVFETAQQNFHEFVHPLSHYMKSPLTAILGYSSLVEDELESASHEEIRHYVRRIGDNTRILVKMIDDLLYLSRLKREPMESLHIQELVAVSIEPFRELISAKDITIEVQEDAPPLVINPEHGRMIFSQLFSNAVRHTGSGTVIRIGYRGDEYFLEDQGPGISKDNLEKVFRIFFTTCSKDEGCTGAGLFTVRKVLEIYRGSVRLESTPGRGTTVFFKIATQ